MRVLTVLICILCLTNGMRTKKHGMQERSNQSWRTVEDVVQESSKTFFLKAESCGNPYQGVVVFGCEAVAGLMKVPQSAKPMCRVSLVQAPSSTRQATPEELFSVALDSRTVAPRSDPKWMEAFALHIKCLDKDRVPKLSVEAEVLSQDSKSNVSFGIIRIPVEDIIQGRLQGKMFVNLRKSRADADYFGAENESARFDFPSFAEVDPNEEVIPAKKMPNIGVLQFRVGFCAYADVMRQSRADATCLGDAVEWTQGFKSRTATRSGTFKCGQGCEDHLNPVLLQMIDEVSEAFVKVEKERKYCHKEEDWGGRCGPQGKDHVACGVDRCCSPAGWCGNSATHCPGVSEYSNRRCKVKVSTTASWKKAKEGLVDLPSKMITEARAQCGILASKPLGVAVELIKDVVDLTLHPEDYTELRSRLTGVKDAIQAMGSTFDDRWWNRDELVPHKLQVDETCFKSKWG